MNKKLQSLIFCLVFALLVACTPAQSDQTSPPPNAPPSSTNPPANPKPPRQSSPKSTTPTKQHNKELISNIHELATNGKTINSDSFGVGSFIADVEKAWGEPEEKNEIILYYKQRNIRIQHDGKMVTRIECFDPNLKKLTLQEIKKQLGTPRKEAEQEGQYYVTYVVGEYHYIELVFNSSISQNPKQTLQLYSVYAISNP